MPRCRRSSEDIGHDAFLDIVANLVGILVILIMVLGVRAQNAWEVSVTDSLDETEIAVAENKATDAVSEPVHSESIARPTTSHDPQPRDPPLHELPGEIPAAQNIAKLDRLDVSVPSIDPPQLPQPLPDVETPRLQAEALRADAHEIDFHIQQVEQNIALQKFRRDNLLLKFSSQKQALAQQQTDLTERETAVQRIQSQLAEAQKTLTHLRQQQMTFTAEAQQVETEVIQHRPTPIARQVLGREEHFRLQNGRLAFVPMRQLTDELKARAEQQLWKLKDVPAITSRLGPRDGFYMKYTLHRRERFVRTEQGVMRRLTVELDHFTLLPERDGLGEPVDQALAAGSDFQHRLDAINPHEVTITVWTYPDSFSDYQTVKEFLWHRGFSAAARPLPKGYPIGGAPDGSRSAAE